MEWELRNLFDDLEVVQEKINDVVTSVSYTHLTLPTIYSV